MRLENDAADEPAIVHDLRVLVEASRKLREEVSDMVSHRPRADLRAYLDTQRRPAGRRAPQSGTADGRTRKKRR